MRHARAAGCAGILIASFILAGMAVAQPPGVAEPPRIYAIQGVRIVPAPGKKIDAGTIVIRDGLIEAVGPRVTSPPDAVVIEGEGLWAYPGLIDPDIDLAPKGPDGAAPSPGPGHPARGAPAQAPRPGAVHTLPLVHPETQAADQLLPFEGERKRQVERYRELGFTTGLVAPRSGIFRGSSVVILLLDDTPVSEMILFDGAAQHLAFERGRFGQGYPTSLMGTVATIRQVVLDAQRHAVWAERYQANPTGMPRPDSVASFEALGPVVSGQRPAIFRVESPADVLLADRISDELGLRAVVHGSGHEWELAKQIAAADRTLILPIAFPKKPKVSDDEEALDVTLEEMRRYVEAPSAAARLHDAGLTFALTTSGLTTLTDFKKNVRKMLDAGLPEDVALAALTTVPARILALDQVTGTLEAGKIANLVLLDGPLFESGTKTRRVFVDGREYQIPVEKRPEGGDPDAKLDPRGEWAVILELPGRSVERKWVIEGEMDALSGTAETREGTVPFDEVRLLGNMLTVVLPAEGDRGAVELTVVITGSSFEGTAEFGPRKVPITGTRASGPEGGER